ncbi:MAG TPA: amino acid adenylation domain-containing protein, partial [Gammaproteobacteria bacterium]|nr:amino acid adenylation domain-containing protein [Gammaproteobacteria bacterium]
GGVGGKRLVAYVVSEKLDEAFTSGLRDYLKGTLPEYMVPSAFIVLEAFPLTPNGKVDKKALAAMDLPQSLEAEYVAPRTPVEEELVTIWCDLLELDHVGIHDNFFQLGGHSLLATQVMSRIQSVFQKGLSLRIFFENPTVAEMSLVISGTQTNQASLVEQRIVPVTDRRSAELSFAQQRLWFLYRLDPDSPFYNISAAWRMKGPLDVGVLENAINIVIQRHEALRTTFRMQKGEPVQLIAPSLTVSLPEIDLCDLPDAEREAEVQRLVTSESRQLLDPENGPLLSVKLLRLAEQEHVFLLIIHHIVSDGWSMGVLMHEISALYKALAAGGQPDPLPALPVQYADFAVWQRNWLQGDVLDGQLQYWKQRLTGASTLELPTDRPRPAVQTLAGDYLSFRFSESLTAALKELGYGEGATLFMILLAAFQVLLHRYTRQQDIVVGSPIAGRQQQETEGLIGFFVNTLALRADLSSDPTFRELLAQVRETTLGAYAYQDLPFEKLVEELQPERNLSHSPVFQVMFALQNIPPRDLTLADVSISQIAARSNTAKYELSLFMAEKGKELSGLFEYNTDLFDETTIRRMAGHFQILVEDLVSSPDQRISTLALLTGAERRQLLADWNSTATDYPQDQCIHQLFEMQVARTPAAVAVVYEDQRLSYAELNAKANQLAHYLRIQGVGPDVLVTICVERSLELVIGVLGILKAGGAYVPLDPGYPKDRLAFMLEDTRAPVMVTQAALAGILPRGKTRVLCLGDDWERIARESDENPVNQTAIDNLLYVIYTSGSTGKPKGVSLSHRSLCNLVRWQTSQPDFMKEARTLQFTSLSFDVSFQEMFTTWCSGGTLVMIAPEIRSDIKRLADYIVDNGIERLFLPFVALHNLAELMDHAQRSATSLKEIITAGEQLRITPAIIGLFTEMGACSLHNHYGPSETHVVTACSLSGNPHSWPALPPIGRPIANTQMYILDRHSCPVPTGVTGELYIGGTALACGYLNRPELTDEKFIPDPFSDSKDARLYKTGDLARYLPDGNIEFLGRIDHQVKIRGFRIELGEIESVLGEHAGIKHTVVVAREDAPGEKRLVAYIVPVQAQAPGVSELRHYLKEKVPDYMIPPAFVMLDALPLTPTGKVDRKALPAPDRQHTTRDEGIVKPRNITEETLVSIWCKLLGLDTVGIHDNFFELGGHSLLSVRLLDKIEKTFGKKLPLAALFQAPTIDALARSLHDENPELKWSTLMAIQPNGSQPPLFFVSGSTFKQSISRYLGLDQPFFGFEDFGVDGKRATYTKVEDLADYYIKELRAFKQNGPYYLAGFCFGGLVAFEMARQLTEQGEHIALLALIDSVNPACPISKTKVEIPVSLHTRYYKRFISIPHRDKPVFLTRSLLRKIKSLLAFDREKMAIYIKNMICKVFLCFEVPIPVRLRDFYIVENYIEAIRDYKPGKYPGKIILFKSDEHSKHDARLGWGDIAEGGVKVHKIAGNHMSMIDDDRNVKILAEQLSAEIEQAQIEDR